MIAEVELTSTVVSVGFAYQLFAIIFVESRTEGDKTSVLVSQAVLKNMPWNPTRSLWGGLEAVPAPFTTRVKTLERYSFHCSSRGKALLHRSLPIRPIRPPIRPPIHCKKWDEPTDP